MAKQTVLEEVKARMKEMQDSKAAQKRYWEKKAKDLQQEKK